MDIVVVPSLLWSKSYKYGFHYDENCVQLHTYVYRILKNKSIAAIYVYILM